MPTSPCLPLTTTTTEPPSPCPSFTEPSFPTCLQEKLNAAIPKVEQQAVQLHHQVAEAVKQAAATRANLAAVPAMKQELETLSQRMARLQQSLAELERTAGQRSGGPG